MKILRKLLLSSVVALAIFGAGLGLPSAAEAAGKIQVINETGYYLESVKYVNEIGEQKIKVAETKMAKGQSHTFHLKKLPGDYVVYISFTRNGKTVYAKGNSYYLKNGVNAQLTLQEVVFSEKGSSIQDISQVEFDAIK